MTGRSYHSSCNNSNRYLGRNRAFTLLEVLMAAFIFGMTMVAVATVLRTGVRAWRTGHRMSEVLQTARISQDVLLRDLNNLIYIAENQYNQSFRHQLMEISRQMDMDEDYDLFGDQRDQRRDRHRRDRRRGRDRDAGEQTEQAAAYNPLALDLIAPPVDLTFSSSDSGKTDTLTFARAFQPRWPSDPQTWGIRRVTYYVEDKVLYRKEEDPYGFNPGSRANRRDIRGNSDMMQYYNTIREMTGGQLNNALFGTESTYDMLSGMYFRNPREGERQPMIGNADFYYSQMGMDEDDMAELLLPQTLKIAEPICEGVEVFDLTYGYFHDMEWIEVMDWESGSTRYRDPPMLDMDPEMIEQQFSRYQQSGAGFIPPEMVLGLNKRQPDDLPGYLAVQLGVRPEGAKGRLHSFTFFYSFPQAQETDVLVLDEYERSQRSRPRRSTRRSRFNDYDHNIFRR